MFDLLDIFWSLHKFPQECSSPRTGEEIPRLIHAVYGLWDSGPLPWRNRWVLGGWARKHNTPDWKIVLWGKDTSERFVRHQFPKYWNMYRSYRRDVQRADFLRYLLLYHFGGFYIDLDLQCRSALDGLLSEHPEARMLACVETRLTARRAREIGQAEPIRNGKAEIPERVANYFMACAPGHPVMGNIIDLVEQRAQLPIRRDYDVIFTTGPDVVTEIVQGFQERKDLALVTERDAGRFVSHLHFGGWRRDQS